MNGRPTRRGAAIPFIMIVAFLLVPGTSGQTTGVAPFEIDRATLSRIKGEAQDHSRAWDYAFFLTDVFGPRMSGSTNYLAAARWAIETLQGIGLANVHEEPLGELEIAPGLKWSGRGWSFSRLSIRMVEPQAVPLNGVPAGWSRGTNGKISGEVVLAPLPKGPAEAESYLSKYKGKLKNKIVLISDRAPIRDQDTRAFSRYDDEGLAKLALPPERPSEPQLRPGVPASSAPPKPETTMSQILDAWNRVLDFLHDEGVLALVQAAGGQGGLLFTTNQIGPPDPRNDPPPTVSIAAEQYNRLLRLRDKGLPIRLEIELETQFTRDADHFNIIADLPGGAKKDEVVMMGAHLDSWFGGTGATDDAAGVAVIMEAARILRKLGLALPRTVRLALWDAEELNSRGSSAFVEASLRDGRTGAAKPLRDRLSVYFNMDNGAGKIRGVYLQGNKEAIPTFEAWLRPLKDLGASTVSIRDSEGSDHLMLDRAGIPAFAFIQDPLNYSRTHHSTLDLLDYVPPGDLMQAATVIAALVFEAANNPYLVPRKPSSAAAPPRTPASVD